MPLTPQPSRKAYFITDQPLYETTENDRVDGLGFDRYAEVLSDFALNTDGPFTIGVNGSWGQGKTSLLRMIEKRMSTYDKSSTWSTRIKQLLQFEPVEGSNIIISVRFNAWQFEDETNPLLPLILTINAALGRARKRDVNNRSSMKKLGSTLTSVAAGVVASSEVSIEASKVFSGTFRPQDFVSGYRDHAHPSSKLMDLLSHRTDYYQAYQLLNEMCEHLGGRVKIVVFIDDLDRCSPAKALQVLESIKLVLWQPGFIFFLALDTQQLERYINGLDDRTETTKGRRYFEKLLQVNFRIPQHDSGYSAFIDQLFKQLQWDNKDNSIKPLLGAPLDFNPRRTIRLVNSIQLIRKLLPERGQFDIQIITIEVLLSIRYEQIYRMLCGGLAKDNETLRKTVLGWLGENNGLIAEKPHFSMSERFLSDLWSALSEDERYATMLSSNPGRAWLAASEDDRRVIARLIEDQRVAVYFSKNELSEGSEAIVDNQILDDTEVIVKDIELRVEELWHTAELNMRKGHLATAEKALLTILKVDDNSAAAHNRLGIIYTKRKDYADAIKCFQTASSIEKTPSSLHNLGLVYFETENYKKAASAFKQALALEENLAARHVAYAKVNEKLGKDKLMFDSLKRAVELEPGKETYTLLMQAYEERNMTEEASFIAKKLKVYASEPLKLPGG